MSLMISAHVAHDFLMAHLLDVGHDIAAEGVELLARLVARFAGEVLAALDTEVAR